MLDEFNDGRTIERIIGEQITKIIIIYENIFELNDDWLEHLIKYLASVPLLTYLPETRRYTAANAIVRRITEDGKREYEILFKGADSHFLEMVPSMVMKTKKELAIILGDEVLVGATEICTMVNTGNLIGAYGDFLYEYLADDYPEDDNLEGMTQEEKFYRDVKNQLEISVQSASNYLMESVTKRNMGFCVLGTPHFFKELDEVGVRVSTFPLMRRNIPFVKPVK